MSGEVSFATNDSDESPFNFTVTGSVTAPLLPEVTVRYATVGIADNDTTPSTGDGTDFGSVTQGQPGITHTFTVQNDGDATLYLGSVSVPSGFTLTEGLDSSLAPGASDTFSVLLDTTTVGTMSGEVSFATNDSDESPFNFTVTGSVTAPLLPEVTVRYATVGIADNDTTPSTGDGTDFGSVTQGQPGITHTFTVQNDGDAHLCISAV